MMLQGGSNTSINNYRALSEEEKKDIVDSEEFLRFFSHASLIVERSLSQKETTVDILRDYREDSLRARNTQESCTLELQTIFEDDSIRSRPVMDLQYSPHYPELFLAAYGSRGSSRVGNATGASVAVGHASSSSSSSTSWQMASDGDEDSPGMVCVWSQAFVGKPEFKFVASSPVLTARFHTQEPHFILGGCYNGQILLWDMRAKSLPVQRSSMSGKGHKHPVYAMSITGTAAAHELISASTDGTLCHWDLSRLTEPTNVSTLSSATSTAALTRGSLVGDAGTNSISVSSMAFSREESSKDILLGSGTGQIYRSSLPYRPNDPITQVSIVRR
jgi:dynein intermediate chain